MAEAGNFYRCLAAFESQFDRSFFVATINSVKIEFDPGKDKLNFAKHGVSLALANDLDWDSALVEVDKRFEYTEWRMVALAPETNRLFYVAFIEKVVTRRIISLRPATRREVIYYVENVK